MIYENVDFQRLSQGQLAEAHRRSTRQIREWTRWGMPRNEDGTYHLARTVAWRIKNTGRDGVVWRPWG